MNPAAEDTVSSPVRYLHFANAETMTSSFRDEAAAVQKSTQQPHSENKITAKVASPLLLELPLMKSGRVPLWSGSMTRP